MKENLKGLCLYLIVFVASVITVLAINRTVEHFRRVSVLEQDLLEVSATAALNEAKLDHLLEGTELSRQLKEPVGDDPIKVVNIALADTALMELRDAINHYLKSRGIE
jgi:hypothetical protein